MRKLKVLAVVPALLAFAMFTAPAASAANAGGAIEFSGTATLPTFPCGTGCTGNFAGTASGTVAGVDPANGTPFDVTFANSALTASNFSYNEPVATCPTQGTANGTISLSGGTVTGAYGTNPVTGGSGSGTFSWTRIGTTAVITTSITITIQSGSTSASVSVADHAVAAFVPNAVPNCASPGPISATVAGVDVVAPA